MAPAGFTSRNVEIAGLRFHYTDWGGEAFAQARASNPRPTDDRLRHRVSHNLRTLPDGTLTFKCDKALRDPGNLFDLTVEQRWEAWRAVSCPVLLVRGDDSDVLAAETAQRMLAENPKAPARHAIDIRTGPVRTFRGPPRA